MNVLITGGFGCIGSYAARDLLNAGDQVVIYDMIDDRSIPRMAMPTEQAEALVFEPGDITDLPALLRVVKSRRIDRIVHLASWQVPACQANPPKALRVVSEGTINVFEAARPL